MKEFLFIYRSDYLSIPQGSPEQMEALTLRWMDWIKSIGIQNKLTDRGNRLTTTGKVVKSNDVVINGPFMEIKEFIGGYTLIKSTSYDDAIELAKGCPILSIGGNVEVREIDPV
ncbi:MAG TPA: YciI family protein [Puia sp.]|nr:YciI family protein [Puia sp.]